MFGYKIIGLIIFFIKCWECKLFERRIRLMGMLFNVIFILKKNILCSVFLLSCRFFDNIYDFLIYIYSIRNYYMSFVFLILCVYV